MKTTIADRSGFTLVEMLVALAIFSFGVLAIVGLFTASIGSNAQGKHVTEATNIAQNKLDYLMTAELYSNLTTITETGVSSDGLGGGISYKSSSKVTDISAGGLDLKRITVSVSWVTKGHEHTVVQSSLRAKDK